MADARTNETAALELDMLLNLMGQPKMSTEIDYYFWMNSDWAYFGNPRLKVLADHHGLQVNYKPVDMGSVYFRTGGVKLPLRSKERRDYRFLEMRRFQVILSMPINLEPKFATQTVEVPSTFAIAAMQMGHDGHALIHAIMHGLWAEERDTEDEATLVEIADKLGLDGKTILARSKGKDAMDQFFRNTDDAVNSGVFGSPFYFFRGEGFWGQDRLEMLDASVAAALQTERALPPVF